MHCVWMQKPGSNDAVSCVSIDTLTASGIEGIGPIWQKAAWRIIHSGKLRVIEHIEGFCPNLRRESFKQRKVFEDSHVEVCVAWAKQRIAPRISKSQTRWCVVGGGIEEKWAGYSRLILRPCDALTVGTRDDVDV